MGTTLQINGFRKTWWISFASWDPFFIYSDGSWSSKGDPWQHVMGNLTEHSGSIGLTFLSGLKDWRERPVYTLQIVNGEGLEAISAFTMELFGILVSLAILSHRDISSTIYSDCEAAVKSLNNHRNSRKPIRASTRDANILSIARVSSGEMSLLP